MQVLARFIHLDRVASFRREIADLFQELRAVYPGAAESYVAALQTCKQNYRLLLVYHHSPHSATTHQLSTLLTSPDLAAAINRNFGLYVSNVMTPEGRCLEQIHEVTAFPALVVVFPFETRYGRALQTLALGELTPDALDQTAARYQHMLETVREARREEDEHRRIQQEQELAYQQALEEAQRRDEEQRRIAEAEEAQRRAEEEAEREARAIEADMAAKRERLAQEAEPAGPATCSVLVRFPNGKKITRRFLQTDTLERVYFWVDANQAVSRTYILCKPFPKTLLADRAMTMASAGLVPSGALVLEEQS